MKDLCCFGMQICFFGMCAYLNKHFNEMTECVGFLWKLVFSSASFSPVLLPDPMSSYHNRSLASKKSQVDSQCPVPHHSTGAVR